MKKINFVKRDFFREGDIVSPSSNLDKYYIYIKPIGFDKAMIMDSINQLIEYDISKDPLVFSNEFDPGMIAEKFA